MNQTIKKALNANLLVFASFLFTAQIGIYLYRQIGTSPAMIWAPIGIALAAVILRGYVVLPGIGLAVIISGMMSGSPAMIIAISALVNMAQPALSYFILGKLNFNRKLLAPKDMFSLLGVSIFATLLVPVINGASVTLYNRLFQATRSIFLLEWWIGGIMSAIILTPLLLRWWGRPLLSNTLLQKIEAVTSVLLLCVVSFFLFATPHVSAAGISLIYILLGILLWIAFRVGSRTMSAALFLMTVISMFGALYGSYIPSAGGLSRRVFTTQVFNILVAIVFFIVVYLEEQRQKALAAMREHELELQAAMKQLQEEDRAKNDFIAVLAHELRNPLATFLSSTELFMLKSSEDPEAHSMAQMMRGRVKTMARLLDDLLDVSRISRKRLKIKKEPVELSILVRRAARTVDASIKERKQSLSISLPLEPITIQADPLRLEQVLANLLANASKYTRPKGHIELTGKYKHGWLSLSVIDSGMGIPPENLESIFEPFFRGRVANRRTDGLGIGLALAKNLIEMHGGNITVESDGPGKGSKFTVRLPAQEMAAPTTHSESEDLKTKAGNGLDVFIVDDNVEAAHSLGKLLSIQGHRTKIVHEGQEALESISPNECDVVLLDIGLPDMDGYEVARKLKSRNQLPVLIALTGYGQLEDKEKSKSAGFDHHLVKPVGFEDIQNAFKELNLEEETDQD